MYMEEKSKINVWFRLHKDPEKKAEGLASDNKARKLMYQRVSSIQK